MQGNCLALCPGPKGVVYLPMSSGLPGFVRDSLLIHIARRGWKVAGHFRNGDFHLFLDRQKGLVRRYIRFTTGRLTSAGVPGESIRSDYRSFLDDSRMAIAPNGTPDIEGGAPSRNGSAVPQVLYLSNLRRRKGVIEAMAAAVSCLDEGHRARFVFVGDLEDPTIGDELQRMAAKHPDAISISGAVWGAEKSDLYRASDVFLFPPTEPEGHPRVVLEAMAAGLPVITTARGAPRNRDGRGRRLRVAGSSTRSARRAFGNSYRRPRDQDSNRAGPPVLDTPSTTRSPEPTKTWRTGYPASTNWISGSGTVPGRAARQIQRSRCESHRINSEPPPRAVMDSVDASVP